MTGSAVSKAAARIGAVVELITTPSRPPLALNATIEAARRAGRGFAVGVG
jgi:methyl-accepting chemotaxis protein